MFKKAAKLIFRASLRLAATIVALVLVLIEFIIIGGIINNVRRVLEFLDDVFTPVKPTNDTKRRIDKQVIRSKTIYFTMAAALVFTGVVLILSAHTLLGALSILIGASIIGIWIAFVATARGTIRAMSR